MMITMPISIQNRPNSCIPFVMWSPLNKVLMRVDDTIAPIYIAVLNNPAHIPIIDFGA